MEELKTLSKANVIKITNWHGGYETFLLSIIPDIYAGSYRYLHNCRPTRNLLKVLQGAYDFNMISRLNNLF